MNVTKNIIEEIQNYNPPKTTDLFKRMEKLLNIVKKNVQHIQSQELHSGNDFVQFHVHLDDGYTLVIHFDEVDPVKPRLKTVVIESVEESKRQLILI